MKNFYLIVSVFVLVGSLTSCLEKDKKKPGGISSGEITANIIFGQTVHSGIATIYEYSNGSIGEEIKKENINNGVLSTTLNRVSSYLYIELNSISITEMYSGLTINQNQFEEDKPIGWIVYYDSGESQTYNLTILSSFVSSLAKFYASNGLSINEAYLRSVEEFKIWFGFDPYKINPTLIHSAESLSPALNNQLRHGFLLSAISLQTANYSTRIWPNSRQHVMLNSLEYIKSMNADLEHDGVLNGIDEEGAQYYGDFQIRSSWYRYQLASHLLFASVNPENVTGLVREDLNGYAYQISNINEDFLTGESRVLSGDSIVIDGLSAYRHTVFTGSQNINWSLSSFLDISQIEITLNDEIIHTIDRAETSFLFDSTQYDDGEYLLRFSVRDIAGLSAESSVEILINNLGLIISNITPSNNSYVSNREEISYTAESGDSFLVTSSYIDLMSFDMSSHHPCVLRPSFLVICTVNLPFGNYSDGPISITITALNNANPIETVSTSLNYIIDNTPPNIDWGDIADNQFYRDTSPVQRVRIFDDNLSSLTIMVNDDIVATLTSSEGSTEYYWDFNPANYSDGIKNITIVPTDLAGNQARQTRMVEIDTIPPHLTFSNNQSILKGQVDLLGMINDLNISFVEIMVNSSSVGTRPATNGNWSYELNTITLNDGTNNITASAVDLAGNRGSIEKQFIIDNTPPVIVSFTTRLVSEDYLSRNYQINGLVSDLLTGIDRIVVTHNNVDITDDCSLSQHSAESLIICNINLGVTGTGIARHAFILTAYDIAGNSQTKSQVISIRLNTPLFGF